MKEIWAYVEMAAGKVPRPSQEALSEAVRQGRQLRARTTALLLGHEIAEEVLDAVGRHGRARGTGGTATAGLRMGPPHPGAAVSTTFTSTTRPQCCSVAG